MIKKFLLGLGITFLSFIGFSNALTLSSTYQNGSYIEGQDSIQLAVFNRGMLGSNRLGNIKRMLGFGSYENSNIIQRKYFWWNDGKAYFYWYFKATNTHKVAGVFTKYSLCNEIHNSSTGSIELSGCVSDDWGDGSFASGFFNSITANDYWGFQNTSNANRSFNLCFSSSSYAKSICFISDTNIQNNFSEIEMENNIDYVSFPNSLLGDPPGRSTSGGGNIEGSSNVGENTSLSGNLMYSTCTNGLVVSYVTQLYGGINNICYAGTNNTGIINDFVARTPISQGLNFKEVYNGSLNVTINGATPYYSSYLDWFNTWMYAMQKYKLGQISFDIFNGQPVYLYAYFDRLYQNGVIPGETDAYNIANICKLALFSDYSQEYNGTQFREVCDLLSYNPGNSGTVTTGEVGSIDGDDEILPPGTDIGSGNNTSSGTIISVDWSGTLSGDTNKNFDGKTFINDFYQKLQANYQKPTNDLTGIVPVYIYVFLIALVLFRFLSH